MKLLITSAGLMNKSIGKALDDLMDMPSKEYKIAFIPTAANVETGDKGGWLVKDYELFCNLNPGIFDIVDISAVPRDIWQPRLESANMLVFGGGNTFHLMHWIKSTGLDKLLPELLKHKVYVGISAGSIAASPSLILETDPKLYSKTIGEISIINGLEWIKFLIIPHFNSPHFSEPRDTNYVQRLAKRTTLPIYALDDQSAIKVDGEKIEVISEGEYLIFNK